MSHQSFRIPKSSSWFFWREGMFPGTTWNIRYLTFLNAPFNLNKCILKGKAFIQIFIVNENDQHQPSIEINKSELIWRSWREAGSGPVRTPESPSWGLGCGQRGLVTMGPRKGLSKIKTSLITLPPLPTKTPPATGRRGVTRQRTGLSSPRKSQREVYLLHGLLQSFFLESSPRFGFLITLIFPGGIFGCIHLVLLSNHLKIEEGSDHIRRKAHRYVRHLELCLPASQINVPLLQNLLLYCKRRAQLILRKSKESKEARVAVLAWRSSRFTYRPLYFHSN